MVMGINAVAVVRIPLARLEEELGGGKGEASGKKGAVALTGDNDAAFSAKALDDATLIYTTASLGGAEPEELGDAVRELLGDVLDEHDDSRGLFVFGDVIEPQATSYAGVVDEVGEAGEWVPIVADELAGLQGMGGLQAMMGNMMAHLPPEMAEMQRRLMSDPAAMQAALAQVGALLSDPTQQQGLRDLMASMGGQGAGMPNPMDLLQGLGGGNMDELQKQAQAMLAKNPGLAKDLSARFGVDLDADDDDDK
jgi:hypothetical protein